MSGLLKAIPKVCLERESGEIDNSSKGKRQEVAWPGFKCRELGIREPQSGSGAGQETS